MRPSITAAVLAMVLALAVAVPAAEADDGDDAEVEEPGYVAMTGGERFLTLAEAVEAASDGGTVVLIADDPSADGVSVGKSLRISGGGYSFSGTLSVEAPADASISVEVTRLSFAAASGTVVSASTPEPEPAADPEEVGEEDGEDEPEEHFPGTVSLVLSRCSFATTGEAVVASGNTSLSMDGVSFSGTGADVACGEGVEVSVEAGTDTVVSFVSGGSPCAVSLSAGSSLSSGGSVTVVGEAELSGDFGWTAVQASGSVRLLGFEGAVWFDASHTYGVEVSGGPCDVTVNTIGLTLAGDAGDGSFTVVGSFRVGGSLDIGGVLTVSEGSTLSIPDGSYVLGGGIVNLGVLDVYGVLYSDVDNTEGTIYAHSTASISGTVTITGNPVNYPVDASVTTVLYATAGEEFEIVLVPDEGTVLVGFEGPSWLSLSGNTVSGITWTPGEYDLTVTATSGEYTVFLQYRVVVSEAPAEDGTGAALIAIGAAIVVIAAVVLAAVLWTRRSRSLQPVELPHAADAEVARPGHLYGADGDLRPLGGGDERYLELDGEAPHGVPVADGSGAVRRGVDDEVDPAVAHQADGVGPLVLVQPEHRDVVHAVPPEERRRALGGVDGEPHLLQVPGGAEHALLVVVVHGDVDAALPGEPVPGRGERLVARLVEVLVDAHDLPGALHLRGQDRVHPGELQEREHRRLHGVVVDRAVALEAELRQGAA